MRLEAYCTPRDIVRAAYIRRAIDEKLDRDEKAAKRAAALRKELAKEKK